MSGSAYSSPIKSDSLQSAHSKRPSKKWTEQEQHILLSVVSTQGLTKINWANVAKALPGRTGKQCREKWKNDLRPDICKDPWTRREEYILLRLHSEVGNQWAEIAKYLPGRSENSIKNHWNATLRSKAEAKGRTLLGLYGRMVVDRGGATSAETFQTACSYYSELSGVEPLEDFEVEESFFLRRPKAAPKHEPLTVKIGRTRRPVAPRGAAGASRKRNRYDPSDSDSLTDVDEEVVYEDEEEDLSDQHCGGAYHGHHATAALALRRQNSAALPRPTQQQRYLPPLPPAASAPLPLASHYSFPGGGYMHEYHHHGGDAAVTIKLKGGAAGKAQLQLQPHYGDCCGGDGGALTQSYEGGPPCHYDDCGGGGAPMYEGGGHYGSRQQYGGSSGAMQQYDEGEDVGQYEGGDDMGQHYGVPVYHAVPVYVHQGQHAAPPPQQHQQQRGYAAVAQAPTVPCHGRGDGAPAASEGLGHGSAAAEVHAKAQEFSAADWHGIPVLGPDDLDGWTDMDLAFLREIVDQDEPAPPAKHAKGAGGDDCCAAGSGFQSNAVAAMRASSPVKPGLSAFAAAAAEAAAAAAAEAADDGCCGAAAAAARHPMPVSGAAAVVAHPVPLMPVDANGMALGMPADEFERMMAPPQQQHRAGGVPHMRGGAERPAAVVMKHEEELGDEDCCGVVYQQVAPHPRPLPPPLPRQVPHPQLHPVHLPAASSYAFSSHHAHHHHHAPTSSYHRPSSAQQHHQYAPVPQHYAPKEEQYEQYRPRGVVPPAAAGRSASTPVMMPAKPSQSAAAFLQQHWADDDVHHAASAAAAAAAAACPQPAEGDGWSTSPSDYMPVGMAFGMQEAGSPARMQSLDDLVPVSM